MRPNDGLCPTSPQKPAGVRVDPPPSLAVANGTMPAATALAEPPLDPPGVRLGSHGLRVTPHALVAVYAHVPNSGTAVLPTGTAPAPRKRATWIASAAAGGAAFEPERALLVGMPSQSSRSLTPKGTPASGPGILAAGDGLVDAGRPTLSLAPHRDG